MELTVTFISTGLGQQTSVSSGVNTSVSRAKTEVKILNEQVRESLGKCKQSNFSLSSKVAKALAKQEAKREKKMTRKKEWDELYYR